MFAKKSNLIMVLGIALLAVSAYYVSGNANSRNILMDAEMDKMYGGCGEICMSDGVFCPEATAAYCEDHQDCRGTQMTSCEQEKCRCMSSEEPTECEDYEADCEGTCTVTTCHRENIGGMWVCIKDGAFVKDCASRGTKPYCCDS